MSLVDKRVFFALLSCFMSKKSSFPSDEEITMELLLVALVDVALLETCGVERPAPPKIVLLKLSFYCLPYLSD
jgi:hypothetical protein